MKRAIAETFRFTGAVAIVIGLLFVVIAACAAVAPYICFAIVWMVANYGLATFAALVACVGYGLFHIGEMISPFKSKSSEISSNK